MDNTITMSTGVVFKIKKAPSLAFQSIVNGLKQNEPKVPYMENKNKGRKEENPNDPDYIAVKATYDEKVQIALFNAALLLCTDVESIPEGFDKPEDMPWIENLIDAGIKPNVLGMVVSPEFNLFNEDYTSPSPLKREFTLSEMFEKATWNKRQRYLAWVKYHAAPADEDILAFNRAIARVNGVSEEDVTAAMAAYKSNS